MGRPARTQLPALHGPYVHRRAKRWSEAPDEDDGQDGAANYRMRQAQRANERKMREAKREIAALEAQGADTTMSRIKLGRAEAAQKKLLAQKGALRRRVGREDAFDAKGRRIDIKAEVPREAAREGVGDALRSAAGKLTGRIKTIDEARRLPRPERAYEAVKRSNPYYQKRPGYEDNCQRYVIAYEARRRGYDVIALPSAARPDRMMSDLSPTGWPKMFKNPKLEPVKGVSKQEVRGKIEGKMDSFGDGSRAIVGIGYEGTKDGHVFIAENAGGRIRFLDPQTGKRDCSGIFQLADLDNTVLLRVDDLEFSDLVGKAVRRP